MGFWDKFGILLEDLMKTIELFHNQIKLLTKFLLKFDEEREQGFERALYLCKFDNGVFICHALNWVAEMAFFSKAGNILRQTVSKHVSSEIHGSNPSVFQLIRFMSSSKVFVGGAFNSL